jgi:hypothetical protein
MTNATATTWIYIEKASASNLPRGKFVAIVMRDDVVLYRSPMFRFPADARAAAHSWLDVH